MRLSLIIKSVLLYSLQVSGFAPLHAHLASNKSPGSFLSTSSLVASTSTSLAAAVPDLDTVALVAGQENYGLAVVVVGEGLWSFLQAPSLGNLSVLVPPALAAVTLAAVSGPMITSGDAASTATGLWIATGVSLALGASYVLRLLASFSPAPKEIAALGLLVAVAGFFSFSQNLVVDGFVSLPTISLPSLPSIDIDLGL